MTVNEIELLQRLVELNEESVRLQRAALVPQLRRTAAEVLVKRDHLEAYGACNGERTMREISGASGVALGTLARWVRQWRQTGLVFDNAAGRIEHLMELEALGLEEG